MAKKLTEREKHIRSKGKELKKIIEEKGIYIKHVAKQNDVSPTVLSAILNGRQDYVSEILLDKLTKYLEWVRT